MAQRLVGLAEQMGAVLERTAYSPNIKERRDLSCAFFDGQGHLLAQAAHIPVHLGAMEESVHATQEMLGQEWLTGDVVVLNDPFAGGSHLPDITVVAPLFQTDQDEPWAFVANRAHHADIGGTTPGSLPADSTSLDQEGLVISPTLLVRDGKEVEHSWQTICDASRTPLERRGDLRAQVAAASWGLERLSAMKKEIEQKEEGATWDVQVKGLLNTSARASKILLKNIPKSSYEAEDILHDQAGKALKIKVQLTSDGQGRLGFDFAGTSEQSSGNLNAPMAVTQASVRYAVYCLIQALSGEQAPPANHGIFASLTIKIPPGSLLDPRPGAAVCAGSVETSQRIVDVLFLALAQALPDIIPAHSHGTMNNLLIGCEGAGAFSYYETLGGGCGASPKAAGASGTHSHMTNTLNTPVEALEHAYPLRIEAYRLRPGTGGHGLHRGGDGLERWIKLLGSEATLTLLGSRRESQPQGLKGGGPGLPGEQWVERNGQCLPLPAKCVMELKRDDVVVVRTPGGGGWGEPKE